MLQLIEIAAHRMHRASHASGPRPAERTRFARFRAGIGHELRRNSRPDNVRFNPPGQLPHALTRTQPPKRRAEKHFCHSNPIYAVFMISIPSFALSVTASNRTRHSPLYSNFMLRVRFEPSPTGYLRIVGARRFIFTQRTGHGARVHLPASDNFLLRTAA